MNTDDKKQRAAAMRAAGASTRDIGRRLGISHMTAQRWTSAAGKPTATPVMTGLPTPPREGGPVAQAAEDRDERALLIALRDRLAAAIDDPLTPVRDLSALTRRQVEILRELARLDAQQPTHLSLVAGVTDDPDDSWDPEAI